MICDKTKTNAYIRAGVLCIVSLSALLLIKKWTDKKRYKNSSQEFVEGFHLKKIEHLKKPERSANENENIIN